MGTVSPSVRKFKNSLLRYHGGGSNKAWYLCGRGSCRDEFVIENGTIVK